MSSYTTKFLEDASHILLKLDQHSIDKVVSSLHTVRQQLGRLFILGNGGSAGHASHAVNDFRKICGLESYTPTDNVSELTARINDESWETSFSSYLKGSRLTNKDAILVLSVGGGDKKNKTSLNLINSINYAQKVGALVLGIVGEPGGYLADKSNLVIKIPAYEHKTPHVEGITAVIWHLIVSHPLWTRR